MPANVQTMAYYGEVPWHGLGNRVTKGIPAEQMIREAGLDWQVQLRPARGARKMNLKGEYSRYEVIRQPRPALRETEVLLGVVGRRYKLLQNTEAFQFFDPIVGEGEAYFETAGALGEGERIWVMARMPEIMEIVRGDECRRYLLLSNSHTGDGSVIVKFTSVRVVCQNTLMLAMEDGQKAYRVRHTKQMQFRLEELSQFLAMTQEVFKAAEEYFKLFVKISMTGNRMNEYMDAVFPRTQIQKKQGGFPHRWTYVRSLFDSRPDLQLPGVQGTLWGAYNAVTCFEDYKMPRQEERATDRLERAWFGGGADIKLLALQKAVEFAHTRKN
jgi:phage/plasmid-like protein (TIGR03299 family)